MAVVNTKSTSISNSDTVPLVHNKSHIEQGNMRCNVATVEVAAADSNGSVYRLVRMPSAARICNLILYNDNIAGGSNFGCGLYNTPKVSQGAVVDATLFAASLKMNKPRVSGQQLRFASSDFATIEQRLWELLGLSEDPIKDYDLCFTGTVVGTSAGTIALQVDWVI